MNRIQPSTLIAILSLLALPNCARDQAAAQVLPADSTCGTQLAVGLPPSSKFDAAHTFFSIGTSAVNQACPTLWTVCVSYANQDTAASNLTEPDITYTFGAAGGGSALDTPYPAVTQSEASPDVVTTEWCRSLDQAATNGATSFYLAAQANFAPPADGTLDVWIKTSIQYTPASLR